MARHYSRRTLQLTRVQMVGVKNKTPEVQSKLINALVVDVNKNQVIAAGRVQNSSPLEQCYTNEHNKDRKRQSGIVSILSSPASSKSASLVSAMPTSLLSVKTFTLAELHKYVSSDSGPYRGINSCGGMRDIKEYELCNNASEYLFFDSAHPSEMANQQLSKLMWEGSSSVTGPHNLESLLES
ncbi:hypothetical protein AgCh_026443 [Apium graveolens]